MITRKDNKVIHATGLNAKELENILKQSKELNAIDPNTKENSDKKPN